MIIENDIWIDWNIENALEIKLNEPDDFLKVKETLTRIGVASKREENTLYQSAHILHKRGRYFIVHFKEMFILDGNASVLTLDDVERRNTIAQLMSDWGLISIVSFGGYAQKSNLKNIKIIPFKEKSNWTLLSKYTIGELKR